MLASETFSLASLCLPSAVGLFPLEYKILEKKLARPRLSLLMIAVCIAFLHIKQLWRGSRLHVPCGVLQLASSLSPLCVKRALARVFPQPPRRWAPRALSPAHLVLPAHPSEFGEAVASLCPRDRSKRIGFLPISPAVLCVSCAGSFYLLTWKFCSALRLRLGPFPSPSSNLRGPQDSEALHAVLSGDSEFSPQPHYLISQRVCPAAHETSLLEVRHPKALQTTLAPASTLAFPFPLNHTAFKPARQYQFQVDPSLFLICHLEVISKSWYVIVPKCIVISHLFSSSCHPCY